MSAVLTLASAGPAYAAAGASFRRVASGVTSFASDGTRYVAWQAKAAHSPIVVLDTQSGKQTSYPICSLEGEESTSGAAAAAGRFLVECHEGNALLDARTGATTVLPEPKGSLDGEWRALGARYVEGRADPHDCRHTAGEAREDSEYEGGDTCIVLYDIATRAVSYWPKRRVPDLDRAGAPPVCPALRQRVGRDRSNDPAGEYAYRGGLLAEPDRHGEAPVTRIRIRGCHGRSKLIPTAPEPHHLLLADGVLSWDTGHDPIGSKDKRGRLYSYPLASGKLRSLPLPQTTVLTEPVEPGLSVRGVFGYGSHAGKTLLWIGATSMSIGMAARVETSSLYAATLAAA